MPKYKVVLTVQDSFGMPKEVDGGTIDIDLAEALTATDVQQIEQALPLEQYVKKTELPDELAEYATDTEVEDVITFTTDKFVTNSFGDYKVGDSLKGQTITTVIAKLLGLSDTMLQRPSGGELPDDPEQPDEPVLPNNPESIIGDIIINKTPMYSVDDAGNIVELTYDSVIVYTVKESSEQPTESGFYQIIDETGKTIESGYQEITVENPDTPYIIALPSGIDFSNKVKVHAYDKLENTWETITLELSDDIEAITDICGELDIDISHINLTQYTLWADLEGVGPTGRIYRFAILE